MQTTSAYQNELINSAKLPLRGGMLQKVRPLSGQSIMRRPAEKAALWKNNAHCDVRKFMCNHHGDTRVYADYRNTGIKTPQAP